MPINDHCDVSDYDNVVALIEELLAKQKKALTEAHQAGIDEAVDRIFGEIDEFKAEVISMDYCDDFKDGIYATIEHILSMPVFESVLVPPELRQDNK